MTLGRGSNHPDPPETYQNAVIIDRIGDEDGKNLSQCLRVQFQADERSKLSRRMRWICSHSTVRNEGKAQVIRALTTW